MKDIFDSIKLYLYERTTSPLSGIFIISWLLWNYRTIITIISKDNFQEKFKYIDEQIYPLKHQLNLYITTWEIQTDLILIGIIYPMITTVLILFLYPKPALIAYRYWKKEQIKINAEKQNLEKNELLTKEKSIEIKSQLSKLEMEFRTERVKYRDEIALCKGREHEQIQIVNSHRKDLENKEEEIKKLKSEIVELSQPNLESNRRNAINSLRSQEKSDTKKEVLKILANESNLTLSHSSIMSIIKKSKLRYDLIIEEIKKEGFIVYNQNQVELTEKGKIFALENNLV